jgi:hypothetical protein
VVVVDVLQPDSSRILGVMGDSQLGPAAPGHAHGHDHASRPGVIERFRHVLRPHSHDAADKVDAAMEASADGIRALWISLAILGATALLQAASTRSGRCGRRGGVAGSGGDIQHAFAGMNVDRPAQQLPDEDLLGCGAGEIAQGHIARARCVISAYGSGCAVTVMAHPPNLLLVSSSEYSGRVAE